jgi:hypothetical protein
LPESLIKDFTQKSFNKIITHELRHLKQRKLQNKFNKYYEAIGFIRVPEYRISTSSKLMHNPDDEPGVKWLLIVDEMKYIMPAMVQTEKGYEQKILELTVRDIDGFYRESNSWPFDNSPYTEKIKTIWKTQFPELKFSSDSANRYSPNEVIADLPQADFNKIIKIVTQGSF